MKDDPGNQTVPIVLRWMLAAAVIVGPIGCERGGSTALSASNVILLIADDVGVDKIGAYREHPSPPPTPNIDALAARGVLFRNAYAPPVCSPSRAAMLTGRYPRRYGLGIHLRRRDTYELPLAELTLPEMLGRSATPYDHSAVGKWHLSTRSSPHAGRHPIASGFHWHAGSLGNLGGRMSYFGWEKSTNGRFDRTSTYATTDTIDDALARVEAMQPPWFLWVAFNAVHKPYEEPPSSLHTRRDLESVADRYDAMAEALDSEIGRLLRSMDSDVLAATTIIFVSDNGTAHVGVTPPWRSSHAKATLYEGGIGVPLIIAGPRVSAPGSECGALVHVVDLFATVAEIAGVDLGQLSSGDGRPLQIDGLSLVPYLTNPSAESQRDVIYQDLFGPNGSGPYQFERRMVRDKRYKLVEFVSDESREFYDLEGRIDDGPNRIGSLTDEQRSAYERLRDELEESVVDLVPAASGV
jgi:arylsulfatase A-like enzyme